MEFRYTYSSGEDVEEIEYPDDMFPVGSIATLTYPWLTQRPPMNKLSTEQWDMLNQIPLKPDRELRKFSAIRGGAPSLEAYIEDCLDSGEPLAIIRRVRDMF